MRGFTLIETVFVVGLTALLLLAIHSLYFSFTRLASEESAEYDARSDASGVIRSVSNIVIPANRILASHSFTTGSYSTGAETLVVRMPSVDATGAIIAGVFDYAVIYQEDSSAHMRVEAGAGSVRQTREQIIGTSLTDLSFSYNATDVTQATSVTVSVNASVSEGHGNASVPLSLTVRARNLSL